MKNYVKDFMDKAVKKKEEREKMRTARGDAAQDEKEATPGTPQIDTDDALEAIVEANISPNDSSSELKRKREDEADESPRNIRSRVDEPPAPPPPPPPPAEDMPMEDESVTLMDDGSMSSSESTTVNGKVAQQASGQPSPMQLATPPINGSGESRTNGSSNLR